MKRRNFSPHTFRNYLNTLKQFVVWLDVPIEKVTKKKVAAYIDYLLAKGLAPKTINCHLSSIRGFYDYLNSEEGIELTNPVSRGSLLRLPRPLPRHLRDHEAAMSFHPTFPNARGSFWLSPNTLALWLFFQKSWGT